MADNDLQVVFEAKDEVEAFLYRTMLQEAGIDVFEKPLTDPMLPHIWAIPAHPRGMQLIQLERQYSRRVARRGADCGFPTKGGRGGISNRRGNTVDGG